MKKGGGSPKPYPSPPDLDWLERALGHDFNNPDLLTQALTHSSATPDRLQSNEQLGEEDAPWYQRQAEGQRIAAVDR